MNVAIRSTGTLCQSTAPRCGDSTGKPKRTLQVVAEPFHKLKVLPVAPLIGVQVGGLDHAADERDVSGFGRDIDAACHLVAGRDHQRIRMGPDTQTEFLRGRLSASHPREIAFEVPARLGHVPVPAFGLGGHPHPTKIVVSVPIAEPPTHLKQRVVGAGIPQEVARRKTLKR